MSVPYAKIFDSLLHEGSVISALNNYREAQHDNTPGAATAALGDTLSALNTFVGWIQATPLGAIGVVASLAGNIEKAQYQLDKHGYIFTWNLCDLAAAMIGLSVAFAPETEVFQPHLYISCRTTGTGRGTATG